MSTWVPTYENVSGNFMPQELMGDNFTSIDELFNIKDDPTIQNLIKLKESTLDILQNKSDLDLDIDKNDYKNEEIDQLIEQFKKLLPEFDEKQNELQQIDESFKKEVESIRTNMKIIDAQIEFLRKLPKDYNNEDLIKEIVEKMNDYSKNIQENEKIKRIKDEYEKKRKEIQKYIYLIRKMNNFNSANMCPVCFTNQVDHFIAPCGHTYCKPCLEKMISAENIYEITYDSTHKCSICREGIKTVRPLFFL